MGPNSTTTRERSPLCPSLLEKNLRDRGFTRVEDAPPRILDEAVAEQAAAVRRWFVSAACAKMREMTGRENTGQ